MEKEDTNRVSDSHRKRASSFNSSPARAQHVTGDENLVRRPRSKTLGSQEGPAFKQRTSSFKLSSGGLLGRKRSKTQSYARSESENSSLSLRAKSSRKVGVCHGRDSNLNSRPRSCSEEILTHRVAENIDKSRRKTMENTREIAPSKTDGYLGLPSDRGDGENTESRKATLDNCETVEIHEEKSLGGENVNESSNNTSAFPSGIRPKQISTTFPIRCVNKHPIRRAYSLPVNLMKYQQIESSLEGHEIEELSLQAQSCSILTGRELNWEYVTRRRCYSCPGRLCDSGVNEQYNIIHEKDVIKTNELHSVHKAATCSESGEMGNENATTAPKTTSDDLADDVNRAEDVAEQSADNPSELPKDHECTRAELIHLPPDESVFNESDLLTEMKCIPRLRSKSLPVLFNLDSEDLLGNYHGRDAPKKCRSLPDVFNIEKEIISLSESRKVNSGGTHDEEGESFAAEGDVQMTNQDHSSKTQKIKLIGRSKSLPGYDTLDLANDHENENSAITKPLTKPTRKLHRSLSLPTILEEIPFSIVKEQPFEKMKLNSELEKLAVLNEEEDDEEKAPCVNIRNVEFQEIVTKDLDKPDVRNDNNDCTSRILATSVGDNQSKLIDSILAAESGENSETPGGCMENQGIYLDEVKDKMSTAIASVDTIVTNGRSAKLDESDKKEAGEDVAERLKAMTQVDWDLPLIQRPRVNTLPLTEYMERIPELPEKDSPIWETTTKGMIHAFSLTPPKGKELDNHKRRSWPMDMRDIKQNPVESASKEDLIFVQTQCHKEDLTKDQGSKHEMLDDTDGLRMPSTEQDHDALLTLWKSHASSYPDTLDLNLMRKPGHEFAETHHMEKLEEENEEEDRKESDAFNANKSLSYDELLDDFEEKFSRAVSYYTEPDFTQSLSSIHREIANGSVERLIALIDSGADVNAPDEHGYPPLHVAVVSGQVDCADCLIRAGADLEGYTEALVNEFYALRDEGRQYNGRAIFI